MKAYLFHVFLALVSASLDHGICYPGYVVNYDTPKNSLDPRFAFLPITGIDPNTLIDLNIAATVEMESVYQDPTQKIWWRQLSIPDVSTTPIITNSNGGTSTYSTNATNGNYFLALETNCGSSSRCEDSVSTEISVLTSYPGQPNSYWPPFQLINQRRTAKFTVNPQRWLYFSLAVTDDLLQASQKMQLYIGAQFYDQASSSSIQAIVFPDADTWPNATANATNGAMYYYPDLATQRGDWVMSGASDAPPPFELRTGLYQVCFFNPLAAQAAKFTVKVGFNEPPKQAATLSASVNHIGFIALILVCIAANMKH